MDTARIFRFSIPGWLLIFSFIFHYWLLGGQFEQLKIMTDSPRLILTFLIALTTSPVLGFIASTIGTFILHIIFGYTFHLKLPQDCEESKNYFFALNFHLKSMRLDNEVVKLDSELKKLSCVDISNNIFCRKNIRIFYTLFNLVLRMKAPTALTEYAMRRWSIFWTHINSITSFFLGLFLAVLIQYYNGDNLLSLFSRFLDHKIMLEIPMLIYIIVALWHLAEAQKSATEIEYKWLIETSMRSESEKIR